MLVGASHPHHAGQEVGNGNKAALGSGSLLRDTGTLCDTAWIVMLMLNWCG